jgi:hypothetical protein
MSPTNLRNAHRHQHEVNGAKDAVLFHQHFCQNFNAYFWLQPLHRAPYFGTLVLNALAIKRIQNYLPQKLLCLGNKNVCEIQS